METRSHPIARFIHVITPLAGIYELPITNLHIFYDLQGGIIAFNRNGSIFLNLRYFEEWREWHFSLYFNEIQIRPFLDDLHVEENKLQEAYISWCVYSLHRKYQYSFGNRYQVFHHCT